ncbi:MAG: DUF2231 domain-containing protein [Candidatus Acidiferrales bacterium]
MNVNPFDIRQALLEKHAQHVVLIHFPIALFTAGVGFDFAAQWRKSRMLAAAAYYNFAVAAAAAVPVVASGLLAWQLQLGGGKLKGILLLHLVLGIVSSAMIGVIWFVHFRSRLSLELVLPAYRVPLELLGVAVIALTAHLGGFLSGVNIPS